MNNPNTNIEVLPIPWMKQKLEVIYDINILGNLYIMFNELKFCDINNMSPSVIHNALSDCNIYIDDKHPLYLYLPSEVNDFTKKLITTFKGLYSDNVYIILGGYKEFYPTSNNLDCVADLYMFYPNLVNTVHASYLIDSSKCYEIFTSLSDTQRVYIDPKLACTITGPTLNYHIKNNNAHNATHISFVRMLDESLYCNLPDYYLKGLTNKNNNFNFNY